MGLPECRRIYFVVNYSALGTKAIIIMDKVLIVRTMNELEFEDQGGRSFFLEFLFHFLEHVGSRANITDLTHKLSEMHRY